MGMIIRALNIVLRHGPFDDDYSVVAFQRIKSSIFWNGFGEVDGLFSIPALNSDAVNAKQNCRACILAAAPANIIENNKP